jgi:hypothetical protein
MMSRRLLRLAAPLLAVGIAFSAAGCSNTTINDAARITYTDGSGTHTIVITRDAFENELRELTANKKFVDLMKTNPILADHGDGGGSSVDADFTASWLTLVITQALYDAGFHSLKMTVSSADTSSALADEEGQSGFGSAAVFQGFSKSFQNVLVARQARVRALASSSACLTNKALGQIVVRTKKDAIDVMQLLQQGARFADVAKLRSADTATANQGGLVGCLVPGGEGQYSGLVEKAPLDTVLGPFQIGAGSQAIYVIAIVRKWDPALTKNATIQQQVQQALSVTIQGELGGAKVYVDPRYGTWGRGSDGQGGTVYEVIPPNVPNPRQQREKKAPTTTTTTPSFVGG